MKRTATWVLPLALLALSCSEESAPPVPSTTPVLFYEPPSVYLVGMSDSDNVVVYNYGDADLVWTPEHVPPGSNGLDRESTVPPNTGVEYPVTWSPGAIPASDSLVATTNDPLRPRVVLPIHVVDPSAPDITPPDAPFLFSPEDGAVFRFDDVDTTGEGGIEMVWSRVDDASGIAGYKIEISETPGFSSILCCSNPKDQNGLIRETEAVVNAEEKPEDLGLLYWRIVAYRARPDGGRGLRGKESEVRTWTVVE